MPNWVSNSLHISGKTHEEVEAFYEKATKTIQTGYDRETGEPVYESSDFSMLAFIAPPEDKMDIYFGKVKPEENPEDSQYEWYVWNNDQWGCKWDASETDAQYFEKTDVDYHITFQTPWSPPEQFLSTIANLYPNLEFSLNWEEEQGFGAEWYIGKPDEEGKRSIVVEEEWDIPNSHADYVERDREDSCYCEWQDNPNDWFEDCPDRAEATLRWNKENNIIDPNAQEPDLIY